MKKIGVLILFTLSFFLNVDAQVKPKPSGRWVVDDADMLSESTESLLTQLLQQHEDSTSNQVLVVTIYSLEGEDLEGCANRLFNDYQIGQEGKDNGVLLLIAQAERKIRIEVGYGLEPYLTDLTAKHIIDDEIKPEFKRGDFDQGVINGVKAILGSIDGTYKVNRMKIKKKEIMPLVFMSLFLLIFTYMGAKTKGLGGYFTMVIVIIVFGGFLFSKSLNFISLFFLGGQFLFFTIVRILTAKNNSWLKSSGGGSGGWRSGGSSWGSGGGSWGGGGGFSGGGGSSGGGGASGGW